MTTQTQPPPPWRPRAIIFDLLTALLDSWTLWDTSTPTRTPTEGYRWRKRYLELTFGAGAYAPYEDLVEASARDCGLPSAVAENLLRDWETLKLWPEAPGVLGRLKERGYVLGIATNCSKELGWRAAEIASRGVDTSDSEDGPADGKVFDVVVTAEESGFYKPRVEAYGAVLEKLGLKAEDVLFVAGSAGDVEGATKAGMRVVWNNHIGMERKGDAVPLREGRTLDEALRDFI